MHSLLIVCLAFSIATINCAEIRDDPVIVQESSIQNDGNFHSRFETGSGTLITQDGHLKHIGADKDGEVIEGEYAYTDKDGGVYDITYTADENGFQPHGAHIPTPPPIPEAIQRSLDYIASHPPADEKKG